MAKARANQAQIQQHQDSHGYRESQYMDRFNRGERPDRFADVGADRGVLDCLTDF